MKDRYGREIRYLRISVTDRCNLACTYCNPERNFSWIPSNELLTLEEIEFVARAFSRLGLKKIRLTGGEPLLRKGIVDLAKKLYSIQGIEEVCITTNGVLLLDYADSLYDVGVRHINISLDTLRPERFKEVSGKDALHRVLAGIERVIELGFFPIKINTVLIKGINDHELFDFARLTMENVLEWRFIEYMPIGSKCSWQEGEVITTDTAKKRLEEQFGPLEEVFPNGKWHGPAKLFRIKGAKGLIGFISPMSHHFCDTCNRLRLTPDGKLRLCLFSDNEVDLKTKIREGMSIEALSKFLKEVVYDKPLGPVAQNKEPGCERAMRAIGG
ncbi:Molybdenum cofactor biosynthesis protein MoaA [Dissulfuribacter thermophilus]|uniref:GTP 3',8-cyclase n=1 Tax=Dissulfuribacter thermophilus TaxID=1156395 RepID=A0A1B9F8K4_9BACT|nr:GTP 3',8-cyclase MoaA [Dissulfuribacter thermophilus]OCC16256.1 Molybdenum cofactor biosynthesis protein MoaA [Dissulfuribacter thermophilus]